MVHFLKVNSDYTYINFCHAFMHRLNIYVYIYIERENIQREKRRNASCLKCGFLIFSIWTAGKKNDFSILVAHYSSSSLSTLVLQDLHLIWAALMSSQRAKQLLSADWSHIYIYILTFKTSNTKQSVEFLYGWAKSYHIFAPLK